MPTGHGQRGGSAPPGSKPSQPTEDVDRQMTNLQDLKRPGPKRLLHIKEQHGKLLLFQREIRSKPVRILVDSGASANFVAATVLDKLKLSWQKKSHADMVKLVEATVPKSDRLTTLPFSVSSYRDNETSHILPMLEGLDIVLGMDWLKRINPHVDWRTGILHFDFCTSSHSVVPVQQTEAQRLASTKNGEDQVFSSPSGR